MWQKPFATPCRPCAGHVPLTAVIAQSALQLLFFFFDATAWIKLQRMIDVIQGGGRAGFGQYSANRFMQACP
ncbi:Uncharacterised protein [Klebsiella pneumoniae]|uniref:Uncharacterized protein n=1 Tax=Klebsiella pneumoniae TaxID=573 RepID=A0A377XGC2_KLEPN|nr:Uncharacterised protein [Klebsiella pneumoniae]SWN03628.1 Uncharacterised protein [Klebsiella pneumoniae]SYK26033.1 Uncharacterised protein [Klebsiella pneumoniae]HBR5196270.1 hypothetical protein [Klebsiella pneumoniae]